MNILSVHDLVNVYQLLTILTYSDILPSEATNHLAEIVYLYISNSWPLARKITNEDVCKIIDPNKIVDF